MSVDLLLPALVALGCGTAAGLVRWPLRPLLTLRILTTIAVVVAATVGVVLLAVVLGFAARSALVLSLIEWCPVVPLHHQIGLVEGAVAVIGSIWVAVRVRRVLTLRRSAVDGTEGRSFLVFESAAPVAYAAPGDPGCVVISRGLLEALDVRERAVVIAHERAHLNEFHHRYLLAGELAVAVVPVLRPLVEQIRLATERCADEAAVCALDGDRHLVARTIARAAMASAAHDRLVGAFGAGSIPTRVNALVAPHAANRFAAVAFGLISVAVTVPAVAGSIQVHHLVELIEHVCNF